MTKQTNLIEEELQKSGNNFSYVSRVLGIDYHALKTRYSSTPGESIFHQTTEPEPADISSLGRPHARQWVIAVKPAGSSWPSKYDEVISNARKKFDAGTHDIYQTTDNGWVVLYLIPYLVPVQRRQFFSTMIVMK